MDLAIVDGRFSVCKLDPEIAPAALFADSAARSAARSAAPWFLARTEDELSLVCEEGLVPAGALAVEGPWSCFRVVGSLDFSLVGILAELTANLAGAGVSVFAVSTFDTDYLLVRERDREAAVAALRSGGHRLLGLE